MSVLEPRSYAKAAKEETLKRLWQATVPPSQWDPLKRGPQLQGPLQDLCFNFGGPIPFCMAVRAELPKSFQLRPLLQCFC